VVESEKTLGIKNQGGGVKTGDGSNQEWRIRYKCSQISFELVSLLYGKHRSLGRLVCGGPSLSEPIFIHRFRLVMIVMCCVC
jgi:hypothetical protein